MTQSEHIDQLATALCAAQAKLKPAIKDSTNPHFRSGYASLQSVWDAALPVLTANGLSVCQGFEAGAGDTVTLSTLLMHKQGQWIRSALTLKPTKADPQGIGSAITYGRRYSLAAILGIVADEDDDGHAASTPKEAKPKKPMTAETEKQLRFLASTPKGQELIEKVIAKHDLSAIDEFDEDLAKKTIKWVEDETKKDTK